MFLRVNKSKSDEKGEIKVVPSMYKQDKVNWGLTPTGTEYIGFSFFLFFLFWCGCCVNDACVFVFMCVCECNVCMRGQSFGVSVLLFSLPLRQDLMCHHHFLQVSCLLHQASRRFPCLIPSHPQALLGLKMPAIVSSFQFITWELGSDLCAKHFNHWTIYSALIFISVIHMSLPSVWIKVSFMQNFLYQEFSSVSCVWQDA